MTANVDTTPLTLGTFDDLGVTGKPLDVAVSILKVYAQKIDGKPCERCKKVIRSLIHDGSPPGPTRALAREGIRTNWRLCDPCTAGSHV